MLFSYLKIRNYWRDYRVESRSNRSL